MTSPDFSSTMTSNVIFPKKNTDLKVALLLSRSLGLHSHQVKMCLSMKIQKVPNKEGTKIMFMSHESLHLYMTVGNWCASGYCLVSPKIFLQVSHGRFSPLHLPSKFKAHRFTRKLFPLYSVHPKDTIKHKQSKNNERKLTPRSSNVTIYCLPTRKNILPYV